jgi:hypothetical protein
METVKASWFGPKGDDVADDAAALQAVITFAENSTAGYSPVLELGCRTYKIGTTLNIRRCSIRGNGAKLRYTGTGSAIKVSGTNAGLHVVLSDFQLAKDLPATPPLAINTLTGTGIEFELAAWFKVDNVEVNRFGVGMSFVDSRYATIIGPIISACGIGMRFSAGNTASSYMTHTKVFGGTITAANSTFSSFVGGRGVLIENPYNKSVDGIAFYGTALEGVYERKLLVGENVRWCAFNDIYWDYSNGGTDIEMASGSSYNTIRGGSALNLMVVNDAGLNNKVYQ